MNEKKCQLIDRILTIQHEGTLDELLASIDEIEAFYQIQADYDAGLLPTAEPTSEPLDVWVTRTRGEEW